MANTCCNKLKLTGPKKDLKKIHDELDALLRNNGNAYHWLEAKDMLKHFQVPERLWPSDMRCAITDVEDIKDDVLVIWTESSWNFKSDVWRAFRSKFHDVDIYYLEEEFGCDIFRTNDTTETMFPEKFALDFNYEESDDSDNNCAIEYFNSEEELLAFCKKVFRKKYKSAEDVDKKLNRYLEKKNDCNYAVLHEIEYAEEDTDLNNEYEESVEFEESDEI